MHFDHERVPERAVHARGAGAHGTFVSYGDWANITGASFLNAPGKETPTFIRFSTVAGSRGSADTVRDVHGFAVRFYTDEGNFDIVGNVRNLYPCNVCETYTDFIFPNSEHSRLLHPGRYQIPRSDPCCQAETRFRDPSRYVAIAQMHGRHKLTSYFYLCSGHRA